jgi:uncharacterized protein YjiS (DUF1127 family)
MPCVGPDHSCNSILTIRSPLGEVRLGAPNSTHPSPRPVWLLVRAWLALREAIAHRRQRRALKALDERRLKDIGVSRPDAERESRKGFRI